MPMPYDEGVYEYNIDDIVDSEWMDMHMDEHGLTAAGWDALADMEESGDFV